MQSFFNRQICIENITSYIDFQNSEYDEIDFITEIVGKTGCSLLLDISNALINHKNRKLNPDSYFKRFPLNHVKQIHLSGGSKNGRMIIDSHNSEVKENDIQILKTLYKDGCTIPAMIERDSDVPPFEVLEQERIKIKKAVYGI